MKRPSELMQLGVCGGICLILGACGHGAPTDPVVEETSFTAFIQDPVGDALFEFVDIDSAVVTVSASAVEAHVTVASLPRKLVFNEKETLPYQLEYCWGVGFDVNYDRLKAGNLELRLCNLSLPGAGETEAEILEFTEGILWQWDESGTMAHTVGAVQAAVSGNTIILVADGGADRLFAGINASTPIDVFAYHTDGSVSSWDWVEDRRGLSEPLARGGP